MLELKELCTDKMTTGQALFDFCILGLHPIQERNNAVYKKNDVQGLIYLAKEKIR